jgi:hypothetical protein
MIVMKKQLIFASLFALAMTGCAEFEEPASILPETVVEESEILASIPRTRASASAAYQVNLNNPYSLSNVQRALTSIRGSSAPTLQATQKYIRLLPQSEADVEYINGVLGLETFSYPFDYDLSLAEMEAHENTLINGYAWQYCLVPPNFSMPPGIEGDVLDYAYMQSDSPGTRAPGEQLDHDLYDAVMDKAFLDTGNATTQTRATAWTPEATIKYISGVPGEAAIPLKNVLVRVNTTFNSGEGYTDANGKVTITKGWGGKFRKATRYIIIWKTDKWEIHDGFGKSKHKGPEQKASWTLTISGDGSNHTVTCASIHRGLQAYYNETHPKTAGLAKYSNNSGNVINVREHHNKHNGTIRGNFWPQRYNNMNIWGGEGSSAFNVRKILSTTFHELGHASDYAYSGTLIGGQNEVQETWAEGIEYAYMSSLYPNYYIDHFETDAVFYKGTIESLTWQGVSLSQLQSIFTTKTNMADCITPLVNLGVPRVMVNYIFSNPNRLFRVNLANSITGDNKPPLNTDTSYSTPSLIPNPQFNNTDGNVPDGTSFNNWTITPNTYTTTSGLNNRTLNVKFTAAARYTISANYTLPDNTTFTSSKIVDLSMGTAPTITGITWQSMNNTPPYYPSPGNYVYITAQGDLAGAVVEWTKGQGCDPYGGYVVNNTTYHAMVATDCTDHYISLTCRAKRNGIWSNTYNVLVPVDLSHLYAPNSKKKEEADKKEAAEEFENNSALETIVAEPAR